jgi:aminoglycoside 6'-N-acetyltransferase I
MGTRDIRVQVRALTVEDAVASEQVAGILVAGFAEHWPGSWPDLEAARAAVRASFGADRISRVAVDEHGAVVGWIGGMAEYGGHVWQLDPLVVRPDSQGRGIGQALVADFEAQVRSRGGLTIWLGSDDVDGMTSLAGVDLFPHVLDHLARIRNLRRHPFEFYQKLGYAIVGALPDANGLGKPDIFLAKSVARRDQAPAVPASLTSADQG